MFGQKLLPWDYGVRNLFRRPSRSALTLAGLTIVVLLVLVVVGFIRGLEASLSATGNPNVVLVYSLVLRRGHRKFGDFCQHANFVDRERRRCPQAKRSRVCVARAVFGNTYFR